MTLAYLYSVKKVAVACKTSNNFRISKGTSTIDNRMRNLYLSIVAVYRSIQDYIISHNK